MQSVLVSRRDQKSNFYCEIFCRHGVFLQLCPVRCHLFLQCGGYLIYESTITDSAGSTMVPVSVLQQVKLETKNIISSLPAKVNL